MANNNLTNAKKSKNDEFYTQYSDIQREMEAYLEYDPNVFRGKVVYCNCDDPYESNFFRCFVLKFNKLGLKQLITTSYKPSPVANTQLLLFGDDKTLTQSKGRPKVNANKFLINEVSDLDGDGYIDLKDIALQLKLNKHNDWAPLEDDGDFRSNECIELLKQSDIVITNPPFSLFREYVKQLIDYDKKFVIVGNMNAITYKEIFPLIKENKIWLGKGFKSSCAHFFSPFKSDSKWLEEERFEKQGTVVPKGLYVTRVAGIHWFTNIDHGRRHQKLKLMTMVDNKRFNKQISKNENSYKKYDNYNAIEVPYTKAIPSDYKGVMGVPISFLDKYNPDQFEILGATQRGCHNDVPDTKKYDNYWEVRPSGDKTGSSGGKTNENANLVGNDGKKNFFINKEGRVIQSAYQRIFIKHRSI